MTVLRFAGGIRAFGLVPEILWAADRCVDVWPDGVDVVITSGRGGKHSRASLHGSGNAIDVRSRDITPEEIPAVLLRLRQTLGTRFDVVFEEYHFHIEHQPKNAETYLTRLAS